MDIIKKIKKAVDELKVELQKLDPTPLEIVEDEEKRQEKKETTESKRWEMAISLKEGVCGGFPVGLSFRALELNGDKSDDAVNWLFEKGEAYLFDHPELFTIVPQETKKEEIK